jgi:hypothetical protein
MADADQRHCGKAVPRQRAGRFLEHEGAVGRVLFLWTRLTASL